MFSQEERRIYQKPQLVEVVCQLRFPSILKINHQVPYEFQDQIRAEYPSYTCKEEKLPPRPENGQAAGQPTVKNYQFISEDGGWKINLTQNFISLSTHRYTRWEEFAKRLDRILAEFIRLYQPAYFSRVGLRFINAFNRSQLQLEQYDWRDLIEPGYLGLMADEDANEAAFAKNEQTIAVMLSGGSRANIKCGKGTLRKVNNKTHETSEEQVYMLDIDVYMDGRTEVSHIAPALNVVHGNADSIFRGAITRTMHEAMEPQIP